MTETREFECVDCGGRTVGPAARRCPDCRGILRRTRSVATGDPLDATDVGELDAGRTPLIDCPRLADELGVARVAVKDEGRNPTGSLADRGLAQVATAAADAGMDGLALASTGVGGQAATAYAARFGLEATVFVPSRATFVSKAMINVHGGDMRVIEGRFPDAREAYEAVVAAGDLPADSWFPAGAFDSPYRHDGMRSLYVELVDQLDGEAPDVVVVPTGHGTAIVGLRRAARAFADTDRVSRTPRVYAAQPAGCAPIVDAIQTGADPTPWPYPDTVCGALEIPDPAGGRLASAAVRDSDGTGVAVSDDDALDAAATVASHEGIEVDIAGGLAAAGAWDLHEDEFSADETVVIVNPGAGNKDADVLRSRLMGRGH